MNYVVMNTKNYFQNICNECHISIDLRMSAIVNNDYKQILL